MLINICRRVGVHIRQAEAFCQTQKYTSFGDRCLRKKVPNDIARENLAPPPPLQVNVDRSCAWGVYGLRKKIPSVRGPKRARPGFNIDRGGEG